MTHKINAESPHFPALPALKQEDLFTLKDGFHVQKFTVVGQYGTHIDAPIHFVEGGRWLDCPQGSPFATLCYRQV